MKSWFRPICVFVFASTALAQEPNVDTAGLLPTAVARALLEQDPSVVAARSSLEAARQEANILDSSPYEWATRISGQQRDIDGGPQYKEWNAALERTIRLPNKALADRTLGKATVAEATAQYGEVMHEAALTLMNLWLDWIVAERNYELAKENLATMAEGLGAVEKRSKAGDAAKLDVNAARAEMAEQRRLENEAKVSAATAWARLAARFPGFEKSPASPPIPAAITRDINFWSDRILAENDELRIAKFQLEMAEATARRASADRFPDPTAGVFAASEQGGRERIVGLSVSIPIPLPGGVRDSRSAKARATADAHRQEVEAKKRELKAKIEADVIGATGAYESLRLANESAAAAQENANLTQRAYTLGEAELQILLLARHLSIAANNNELSAQQAALRAYYDLVINAHLVWDLAED